MRLSLEAEHPDDNRSLLRITLNGRRIAEGLTTMQAHLMVGEILERFAMPSRRGRPGASTPSAGATLFSAAVEEQEEAARRELTDPQADQFINETIGA